MRLGRKLAEGFAVDHEADRASAGRRATVTGPSIPVEPVLDVVDTDLPEPVRTGPAGPGRRRTD